MAEDRNTEQQDGQERPPRPVTAAARRERRASARPAARKDAAEESTDTGKPSPKGKSTAPDTKSKARRAKADEAKSPDAKGRPTRAREDSKAARPGLFSRLFRFLREVVAELRKVIWPTRKQMITYTTVVLVFLAVMVALIAGMDFLLVKGVTWLFG